MTIRNFEFFDYHRTIVGYHGTTIEIANRLVDGAPFKESTNLDDWLGTGVYFWEYAPRQAWWWAKRFKNLASPAVVGAMIRLGRCFDLLDPFNVRLLRAFHDDTINDWKGDGVVVPENGNQHKNLDCAVLNAFYLANKKAGQHVDSCRAVYVPTASRKRAWKRSWIYEEAHIQICIRSQSNILAVWHVQPGGRYGKAPQEEGEMAQGE